MKIALWGFGVVGQGVADMLAHHPVEITHLVVRDPDKSRDVHIPHAQIGTDAQATISQVDLIIEATGEVNHNRSRLAEALRRGVPVVTANKELLSAHLEELLAAGREGGARLRFEAAVAGAVPVIRGIGELRRHSTIDAVSGIINGSCNYLLSRLASGTAPMARLIAEAQAAGFLEADPSADVDGYDAQRKLRLLATLAFGGRVDESWVRRDGITHVSPHDISAVAENGRVVKQLSVARLEGDAVDAVVQPTAVLTSSPWGHLNGSANGVDVSAVPGGAIGFRGQGAGRYPTAAAMVADVLDELADAPAPSTGGRVLRPVGDPLGRFYVRGHGAPVSEHWSRDGGLTERVPWSSLDPWRADPHAAVIAWD